MIAACPKCHTRYRVQPEQLGPDGARLRCSACSAVFRVRAPSSQPPAAVAPERSALSDESRRGVTDSSHAAHGSQRAAGAAPRGEAERSAASEKTSTVERAAAPRPQDADAEPGPSWDRERLVVVAHADAEMAKSVAESLEGWGLETLVAHDGVEAMLAIQRALPRAVVLDAALPKMYGFQVCEIVKRNESLRETRVVLVGAIHKEERYRRAPSDLYGADVYVEPPDLPDALLEIMTRFGLPVRGDAEPGGPPRADAPYGPLGRAGAIAREARSEPFLPEVESPTEAPSGDAARGGTAPASGAAEGGVARSEPKASGAHQDAFGTRQVHRNDGLEGRRSDPSADLRVASRASADLRAASRASANLRAPSSGPAQPQPAPAADDPLAAERAKAERLARIIVSDIVLYNPEKFAAAARAGGDVAAAMRDELEEGRALFRERIDPQVRAERDHLAEELDRAAKARSGQ